MSGAGAPTVHADGHGLRVAVVAARWHEQIMGGLLDGALTALAQCKVEDPVVIRVPGTFELPVAAARMARSGCEAVVALGVVIRGETYHFEIVAGESARGIMALTLDGLAIGNGILTVENEAQALARARREEKDKGGEAAKAALAMMQLREKFSA